MRKFAGRFTILELLVVVSIIMILASLLLPALRNAKVAAKRTQCAGNLRQIGILMAQYLDDNSAWYPYAYNATDKYKFWAGKLVAGSGLKNLNLFICPANSHVNPDLFNGSLEARLTANGLLGYVSYGVNCYGTCPTASTSTCAVKARSFPSDLMLAMDCDVDTAGYDGWYIAAEDLFKSAGSALNSSYLMERHNRRFNLLYVDGHGAPFGIKDLQVSNPEVNPPWYEKKYCLP